MSLKTSLKTENSGDDLLSKEQRSQLYFGQGVCFQNTVT